MGAFAAPEVEIATLAAPLTERDGPAAHVVKVVCDAGGDALYFSRSPIPHLPDPGSDAAYAREGAPAWARVARRHVGVYAFRPSALARFCALPTGRLEALENPGAAALARSRRTHARDRRPTGRRSESTRARTTMHSSPAPRAPPRPTRADRGNPREPWPSTSSSPAASSAASARDSPRPPSGMILERRGLKVSMQKLDPYNQRRPRHDEPLPARRGVRARRRVGDGPRTWATTSATRTRSSGPRPTTPRARSTPR